MGFKSFVKKKYGEAKEGIKKDIAYRKEVSTAAREAASVERKKQAISTAVSREQHRGSEARKRITAPRASFGGGLNNIIGGTTPAPQATTRRKVTTYVKKGKGYVKKTSYKPVKNRAAVENNQDQFSSMFGSSTKKKKGGIPNLRL